MNRASGPGDGLPGRMASAAEIPAYALFGILWEALADLLGSAATATLLRRAARRGAMRNPELLELAVERQGLAWVYTCPPAWTGASPNHMDGLRALIGELRPILVEMTGPVVVQHLEQIHELRERGLLAPQEERT
jgi:hypothetical protein